MSRAARKPPAPRRPHPRSAGRGAAAQAAVRRSAALVAAALLAGACSAEPAEQQNGPRAGPAPAAASAAPRPLAAARDVPAAAAPATRASGADDAPETPGYSRDARFETERMLRADLAAVRHRSDGGGTAALVRIEVPAPTDGDVRPPALHSVPLTTALPVSGLARLHVRFTAGPLGIAAGGALYLQSSPFWEWSPAQTDRAQWPGYATAHTQAPGVALEPRSFPGGLCAFVVRGRALRAGETVDLVYGAGPALARLDRYAEAQSALWVLVDGDGDGVRAPLAQTPSVRTAPGAARMLLLKLPSTAEPGEEVPLRISLLDAVGNAGIAAAGEVELDASPGLVLPAVVSISEADRGSIGVLGRVERPGIYRVGAGFVPAARAAASRARSTTLRAVSEPMVVARGVQHVLWADLHGHSNLSDGTGTPEDWFRYARDVAALDAAALTDHDHWGMRPLDGDPRAWQRIRRAVARAHEPGRFVALLGYEWTSWLYGHRHVLYFADDGPLFSSLTADRATETPAQLWDALRGLPALTFAHHSAGGPVSTAWSFAPDPALEPVTEIVSVHGSSEAPDSPRPIYDPVPGNYVRDALGRGHRLGFVGSGDGHDGHPGLAFLASPSRNGGLAALLTRDRTRAGVLAALRARHAYATNGPRIWLRVTLDGRYTMGDAVPATPRGTDAPASQLLEVRVAAALPLERIDLVRNGSIVARFDAERRFEWSGREQIPRLASGETLYVRVVQIDDGAAWSSPFFAD